MDSPIPGYADNAVAAFHTNVKNWEKDADLCVGSLYRRGGTDEYKLVVEFQSSDPFSEDDTPTSHHTTRWFSCADSEAALQQGSKEIRDGRFHDVKVPEKATRSGAVLEKESDQLIYAIANKSMSPDWHPEASVNTVYLNFERMKRFAV